MLVPIEVQCLERSEPTPKILTPIMLSELDQKHQSAFFSGKPAMIMPLSRVKIGKRLEEEEKEEENEVVIGTSAAFNTATAVAAAAAA